MRESFDTPVHAKGMPFSDAVLAGETLYTSGAIGFDIAAKKIPESFAEECRVALRNLGVVLRTAGFDYPDVVKATAFITDFALFSEWNTVYREFFQEPFPARSTVGVASLAIGARIEVELIAVRRK